MVFDIKEPVFVMTNFKVKTNIKRNFIWFQRERTNKCGQPQQRSDPGGLV